MKYVRQYVQETVRAESPKEFDMQMNMIFTKASRSGKDPDVHYYPDGYSATVRYWITAEIAETLADFFEQRGQGKHCSDCPLYILPEDKRIKYSYCEHSSCKISANDAACDHYYETYEEMPNEVKTLPFRKKSVLSK